jgi:hypothetical protein
MLATFNPTRRNRNIGTAKQGHGKDNRLVIPELAASSRTWNESLGKHRIVRKNLNGREIVFIIEETSGGCVHACSVDDILHILSRIPESHWLGMNTFVLRQSTRKQRLLAPAWGHMFYSAELGLPGRNAIAVGSAIFLEAVNIQENISWSTSLDPDDRAELERLRSDGHRIEQVGRKHVFSMTKEAVRATQLYRTLLHEIGHWFDWLEKVEGPTSKGGDLGQLSDKYFQRPQNEREAYAHRYAEGMRLQLELLGVIPF